jgi:Fur family transcriptional regulator, iron response regulator
MAGCPVHEIGERLRAAKLRPTQQRIALGWLLFGRGNRHVTAEILHQEAMAARVSVSLATIYNTLHQFSEAGLLIEIGIDGPRTYFDTNTSRHHHFLLEDEQMLLDIPEGYIAIEGLPEAPEGMETTRVDLIVRVRRKPRAF